MKTKKYNIATFLFFAILVLNGCFNLKLNKTEKNEEHIINEEHIKNELNNIDDNINNDTFIRSGVSETGMLDKTIEVMEYDSNQDNEVGKPGWITVSQSKYFPENISLKAAKNQLLEQMRNEAIIKKSGVKIEIDQMIADISLSEKNEIINNTSWSGFFRSAVSGIITDQRQKHNVEIFNERIKDDGLFQIKMQYEFYVVPVGGKRDVAYQLHAYLENNMLKTGDEINIFIETNKDSYVFIFNLMPDNKISLMFPNSYMKNNYLESNSKLIIPDPSIKKYLKFIASGVPGNRVTMEGIYVVCMKNNVPLPDSFFSMNGNEKSFDMAYNTMFSFKNG